MSTPSKILAGASGWTHPQWDGTVFPAPRPRGFHRLEYLARFLDTIEIDASFHHPLRAEVTRLWLSKVEHNPRFQFTALLGRRFTHERDLDAAAVATFKEGLWPLHKSGRLGCVVMQFPWSFRFTAENREFLIALRRAFHEFPLVAEMRHDSWLQEEALGTMIDYRVGFVNIDQPSHTRAMPPTAYLTSPIGYVRMHGRNRFYWREEFENPNSRQYRANYLYGAVEFEEWKPRLERVSAFSTHTFVVFTNDARGASVVNALELKRLQNGAASQAPSRLVQLYPGHLAQFRADAPVQTALFAAAEETLAVLDAVA
jgi:uncharacterized protein YecE (DUF72 family)